MADEGAGRAESETCHCTSTTKEGAVSETTEGAAAVDADEHPSWCDPKECLVRVGPMGWRHRSAPVTLELCNDLNGTRLGMRLTQSALDPSDLGLEINVDSEEEFERHEVIISRKRLAGMNRLTLSLMVRAIMREAVPVRPPTGMES